MSFVSYRRQFGFHPDVPTDMNFDNLPDPETMLRCHHVLTHYGTRSQVLLPGDAIYSSEIPLVHFVSGGLRCSFP